jgi:hypothetical protein
MLASTVQFSTNDQPTTRYCLPPNPEPTGPNGMKDQVMPGAEKQQPRGLSPTRGASLPAGLRLFLQIPNRVLYARPNRTTSPFHARKRAVLKPAGRCQTRLASVSAI